MLWIALFCVTAGLYWLRNYRNSRPDEPPYLPGAWPIFGHMPRLLGDTCQLWTTLKSMFEEILSSGGAVRFKLGPETVYVVTDPSDVVTVANTCLDKMSLYDIYKPWGGDGLLTSKGSTWKSHRKLLNPAFSQSTLNIFMDVFNSQARNCVKVLRKEVGNGYFDHSLYTKILSMDAIGHTALGVYFGDSELKEAYIKNMDLLLHYIVKRVMMFWLLSPQIFRFSTLKKKQDDCIKFIHGVSNAVLLRTKAELHENIRDRERERESLTQGSKFKSYMNILLELLQQGVLNDREVREHVDTIIATGTDTTATTLTFILLLLGAYPAVQEKAVAELKEVFGDEDRDVEKKDLSQLIYLDAVIKESLRLYPIAPIIGRQIDKDIKLKNCTLYAGHMCGLILYAVNTHPSWGPDRYSFRPERWLDPSQLPENGFAAFSIGRRMCIGKGYASVFMKTILIHLLRHYKINADDRQLKLKIDMALKAKSGHFISIEERTATPL